MSLKIEKAMHFAKLAHECQFRADGVEPYFNHVYRVFKKLLVLFDSIIDPMDGLVDNPQNVGQSFNQEDILCAALLHDTVEDNKSVDLIQINKEFGFNVETLVWWLTNRDDKSLNRKARIDMREDKYHQMPNAAKIIKLADRIDNLSSMEIKGNNFVDKYLYETYGLLYAIYSSSLPKGLSLMYSKLYNKWCDVCIDKKINIISFQSKWQEENKDKVARYESNRV